ncbi:MAG TPA: MFS transporter [Paenibacillus sp.]|jgi:PPP family 3-phenylpropionic acid transporter
MALLPDNQHQSSSLLSLGLLNFFIYGTTVIFAAFFQLYLQDIGMNKLEIGILISTGPLISLLAHPFWRLMSDRSRNIRLILLVMLIGLLAIGHLLFRVDTFQMLYIVVMLVFFFQSPLLSQSNSLTLGYVTDSNQRFETYRLWGSFGWATAALAAGITIDATGKNGFSLLFSIMLILSISSTLILPSSRYTADMPWISGREFRQVLKNKYFVLFIVLGLFVAIPNSINALFMPLFISDLGGNRLSVGIAVFLSTLLEMAAFVLLNRYLKNKITYLIGTLTIVSILFALRWNLMADATHPTQIIIIQLLHAITFGGFFYVGTRSIALFLPSSSRAAGQAVYSFMLSGVTGIVAGLLGGFTFQDFGPALMYQMGMMMTLFAAIGFGALWYHFHKNGYPPVVSQHKS